MQRRGFILGALAAPAVITTPGLLMPVRALVPPVYTWDCGHTVTITTPQSETIEFRYMFIPELGGFKLEGGGLWRRI